MTIEFDRLIEENEVGSLRHKVAFYGREMADRLNYGPGYRRAAREHYETAWRFAGYGDERLTIHELTLALIYAGNTGCGHDGRDGWYSIPHTVEQKALAVDRDDDVIAWCGCGAFYRADGTFVSDPKAVTA